ncbi:MAG: electron transfer flavoprotein subunit beta/FixA family protein [Desulfobacterales bacterium]
MNTVVCVKQVADIYIDNGYDPDTKGLVENGLVYTINPFDEIAVEEALRIRERSGEGQVTVISIGPSRVETVLRWCLAMGVDHAVHVMREADHRPDPWGTAFLLSDSIGKMDYSLVLFGKKAIDHEMGQVGTFVAELLDLPVVTAVTHLDVSHAHEARVQRSLERGNREEVICPIPAVFTVDKTLNKPRYPTFPDRKAAWAKPIEQVDGSEPREAPKMEVVQLAPPKLRPKKIISPDSNLSAADRIRFVMTGGMNQKKGGAVGGDPRQMANAVFDFLKERNFIGKPSEKS